MEAAEDTSGFLLVLGDNPWIDPDQVRTVWNYGLKDLHDYVVTSTPELPRHYWSDLSYPSGTRIQYIRSSTLSRRLHEAHNPSTAEHISLLFHNLPSAYRTMIVEPTDGWRTADIANLNISINTYENYTNAMKVLQKSGAAAPTQEIVETYITCVEG
jgi:spore coat polysaccharide biosynthesis protein SpsF (cytidylyltransferase family)